MALLVFKNILYFRAAFFFFMNRGLKLKKKKKGRALNKTPFLHADKRLFNISHDLFDVQN